MTNTRFVDGTVGSQSQVAQAFDELRTQGQDAINKLVVLRENTLLLFNNALSGLNGKRVRANRLPEVGITNKFVTSDIQDINQSITTASVRADSNSISLRERAEPGEAIVNQVRFSASEGTIQALQVPGSSSSGNLGALYRVATTNGNIPIGTFDIALLSPVSVSLLIFDMMDTPSTATIQAFTSQNGINFTEALSVTRNGYRLAAWMKPEEAKFLRITIMPALPDILGGSVFTFGLTDLHAFSVQYHLRSDVYTNQIEIAPRSAKLQFSTSSEPGLLYFLSLASDPPIEIFPGDIIPVPGATVVNSLSVPLNSGTGKLLLPSPAISNQLPSNTYLSSLIITDVTNPSAPFDVRIAPGLSAATIGLTNQYFTIDNSGNIYLVVYNAGLDSARIFDVSYTTGPSTIPALLQVELTTNDLNTTPIYSGAELIEA